jgi:trehalose 6-phosphate synthase/phosphatase
LIWPLFHYFPENIQIVLNEVEAYQKTNELFCQTICDILQPGDKVWVQDYQLMLLPHLLRKAHPNLSIAYFHHIPFPAFEIFRIIQTRINILEGLLGADIIGFHTLDYVRHFLISVNRILDFPVHLDEIYYQNRKIKAIAHPLGVDVNMIDQTTTPESKKVKNLRKKIGEHIVLLSIDRLDYTKGIPERLEAYRCLLKKHPEYIGKIILIQICVPTRTDILSYRKLRANVERLVGQINGEFGEAEYSPVQYFYRSFSRDELIAFYKVAHIAIVTPLRDGLNLVCKEYVASRTQNDGVLILSEMAGAAAEMTQALLVNPYDTEAFAETIDQALKMNPQESTSRMTQLRAQTIHYSNINWIHDFIEKWQGQVH